MLVVLALSEFFMSQPIRTASDSMNPFQSPGELPIETADQRFPNTPSPRVLWPSVAIGSVLNALTSLRFYLDPVEPAHHKLIWIVPDLAHGAMYGLGLALLVDALLHRRFRTLMPGHWRLIASMGALLLPLWWMGPSIFGLAVFLAVGFLVQETATWKVYAWLCAATHFSQAALLIAFSLSRFELGSTDLNLRQVVFMAASLFSTLIGFVAFVTFVVAIVLDLVHKVRRDAYHYAGLVLVAILPAMHWIYRVFTSDVFVQMPSLFP